MMLSPLFPLAKTYAGLAALKNFLYDNQFFPVHKVNCSVVAIGNLTIGGSGKTPVVDHLLNWSVQQGLAAGVVSRGYRGSFQGVQRVPPSGSATFFGDEPAMLARRYPDVPIFVSPDRVEAAQHLLKYKPVQLIFADDAFQHRRLHRDFNILVIDATEDLSSLRPLPQGRLREGLRGASRADALFYTKVNLAPKGQLEKLEDLVNRATKGSSPLKVLSDYVITSIKHSETGDPDNGWKNVPILAVSAVARPRSFESSLKQTGKVEIKKHLVFRDHHHYSPQDIELILSEAKKLGISRIVVTEKDWVKLKEHAALAPYLYVAELGLEMKGEIEKVYEAISSLVTA